MKFNLKLQFDKSVFSAVSGREVLGLLIEIFYLAIVFAVPLWFAYLFPTYNIFEFNKSIFFRVLIWLLFLFTALKIIFYYRHLGFAAAVFFKKYWFWPLIFIAGLSLTLFSSSNPLLSFYGSIERQNGLVSYLFYFLWFIMVGFNVLTINNHWPKGSDSRDKRIRRIVVAAVISASLAAVYGILQIFNIDFIHLPESAFETGRTSSSFGQPNFLASWLLLVIPLSWHLGIVARRFLAKSFYFFAFALQIICLFLTGSRGGLLALLFAGALLLAYLFITAAWPRRRKFLAAVGFIFLAVVLLMAADRFLPGRISNIFDFKSGSVGARANFYVAAADAIKARPLLGYGLESGSEVFIKYYEPDWAVYGDVGQSADRAHNLILDTLINAGFYGLVLTVILYYFFFSLAKDNIKKKRRSNLSLALALGSAAYLFSLLFSFSVVAGEVYFWLFLALLVAVNYETDKTEGKNQFEIIIGTRPAGRMSLIIKAAMVAILVVLVLGQIAATFRLLIADYYFNKIYLDLPKPDYFTAVALGDYLKEQRINPVNREAYDYFLGDKLSEFYPFIGEPAAKKAVAVKLEEVDRSLPESGYRNLLVKAKINNALGHYQPAQAYLDRVIALTPYWPLVYMEQGKLSTNRGDFKKALVAYNMALLNLPAVEDSRLNDPHRSLIRRYQYFIYYQIGDIYEREKKYAAAGKYFRAAYGSDPSDYALLKRMADMEYRQGHLQRAIEYTGHGFKRNPGDYKWPLALASLYYESGDKKSALEYLDKALKLEPGNQEILDLQKTYRK